MPELPEVETVRRGLEPVMAGVIIAKADVRRPDLRWPFPDRMTERLTGARVDRLRRRAKYILADLDSGETLIIHLGMSGRMTIQGDRLGMHYQPISQLEKHDHVVFDMKNGVRVVFNDPRRFGAMDLIATGKLEEHKLLAKLGPEPLSNSFDSEHLTNAFQNKKSPIKSSLLDQRVVSGLGNIYVCEALFRSGISPKRLAGKVSPQKIDHLVGSIRDVLREAIEAGGSSLKDFKQTDGELGYFQHTFAVYDQEGSDCRKEGCSGSVKRIVQSGRSSFYCNSCQK